MSQRLNSPRHDLGSKNGSLADTSIRIPGETASHLIVVSLQMKRERFCAFKIRTHKACGQTKALRKFWSNNPPTDLW
ncbi:hypothetical protein [Herbaspirillum sp. alder98]|uniref:hypothetical protein n=1 Tax=Herbaspirillum sp. alder98 TaxID=2913096 RepID=UPI001CD87303|nr:hypothetical protein [Herbaspirillum sp. alder98]MCA1327151.1 hypothetical protein [Herbaspirillum sp. alder98]